MNRSIKPIRVEGNIAYVPLTKGYEAIIDAEDVPLIDGRSWHVMEQNGKCGNVRTVYAVSEKNGKTERLHRTIFGLTHEKIVVDHIDCNGLNNRKSNLRLATASQNSMNRRIHCNNSSGYKGVSWFKPHGYWMARIQRNKVSVFLGNFNTPEDAAAAYARASAEMHREYGRLR